MVMLRVDHDRYGIITIITLLLYFNITNDYMISGNRKKVGIYFGTLFIGH